MFFSTYLNYILFHKFQEILLREMSERYLLDKLKTLEQFLYTKVYFREGGINFFDQIKNIYLCLELAANKVQTLTSYLVTLGAVLSSLCA